jgi:hypothetical protein
MVAAENRGGAMLAHMRASPVTATACENSQRNLSDKKLIPIPREWFGIYPLPASLGLDQCPRTLSLCTQTHTRTLRCMRAARRMSRRCAHAQNASMSLMNIACSIATAGRTIPTVVGVRLTFVANCVGKLSEKTQEKKEEPRTHRSLFVESVVR